MSEFYVSKDNNGDVAMSKLLSPRRNSSQETTLEGLAREQLFHFGIDPETDFGRSLYNAALDLYRAHADVTVLWEITADTLQGLDHKDRVAYFNAKKFLSFQVAKVLDTLQNPFRKTYQGLGFSDSSLCAKGPYPVFDNVTSIFSANPVIVRTATYIYSCMEWVEDAFRGREMLHEMYSRIFNPTSISLANHIVDLEAGPLAGEYLAWNFNSGMAAIDVLLGHLLRRGDVLVSSRNIYGGTHQLLEDYYAPEDRLDVALEWCDGTTGEEFGLFFAEVEARQRNRLDGGSKLVVYLESPCNPHGYVLDVPSICRVAHDHSHPVVLDSTIATPFLSKPLQREDRRERPDYLIHSYTKDLTGTGTAIAGVVIAENHRMFIPKGDTFNGVSWDETLFWDVYYVKGAFLDSDKAFEVINGIKTLELRMLQKCINTLVLARFLNSHPAVEVCCNALEGNRNAAIRERTMRLGLPAPLFTINFEEASVSRRAFVSFFDCLAPAFDHQITLGQSNTVVLCPALTSHSELDESALAKAGITPTTIRISVGGEHPKELIAHLVSAARLGLDPAVPGFSESFMGASETDQLMRQIYTETHERYIDSLASMGELLR